MQNNTSDAQQARLIACAENASDGFTINANTGKPHGKTRGYFVSMTNNTGKPITEAVRDVTHLKENVFKLLKNAYFGGWRNGALFYIDLSRHVPRLSDALLMARLCGQKAIYDIKNNTCIEVTA